MTVEARAPGRVNLIGEHTDYNGGLVLPMAIDRSTAVEARSRRDRLVTVGAVDLGETDAFGLDRIERTGTWRDYVRGVIRLLDPKTGFDLRITSDVPRGAGLSSSAALEVAVARAVDYQIAPRELVLLCQRAENEFVGVRCGVMDQFTATFAHPGHALLLDCSDLSHRHVPVPDTVAIVVADSGMRHDLATSGYNARRASCERAAHELGLRTLRDASPDQIAALPGELRQRARHVVTENQRTSAAAIELGAGNVDAVGALMDESHRSMRDDFEIVPLVVDRLVAAMRQVEGCYGSRLTGAGFGGCTVSLVANDAIADVRVAAERLGATVHLCRAAGGVTYIEQQSSATPPPRAAADAAER